jgi:hypothetical protein
MLGPYLTQSSMMHAANVCVKLSNQIVMDDAPLFLLDDLNLE